MRGSGGASDGDMAIFTRPRGEERRAEELLGTADSYS